MLLQTPHNVGVVSTLLDVGIAAGRQIPLHIPRYRQRLVAPCIASPLTRVFAVVAPKRCPRSQTAGSGMPATSPLPTPACILRQTTSETWRYKLQQMKMATVFSSTFPRLPMYAFALAPEKKRPPWLMVAVRRSQAFCRLLSLATLMPCLSRATFLPPARHLLARDTLSSSTGDPRHEVEDTLAIGHAEVATPHVVWEAREWFRSDN